MPVEALRPEQLRRMCSHDHFPFNTTAELEMIDSIIGQPRGTRAIEFGVSIESHGYNVFVLGEMGTGRMSAIRHFLEQQASNRPAPNDWVYVNNFTVPHQPRAISLPPGAGRAFRSNINELINRLKEELPRAFNTETYGEAVGKLTGRFDQERETLLAPLHEKAAEQNFAVVDTPSGPTIAPLDDDKVMAPEQYQQLPLAERKKLDARQEALYNELDEVMGKVRRLDNEVRADVERYRQEVAQEVCQRYFAQWEESYSGEAEVLLFLRELRGDVLQNLQDFTRSEGDGSDSPDLSRYEVNLFVDNSETAGAPVILEANPTLPNLFGRMEYEMRHGVTSTHFTNLKAGSLHRANGGYLLLKARDLLRNPPAWEALKRAIQQEEIQMQSPDKVNESQVLAKSLDPEPIPLAAKVILVGNPRLYYGLYDEEEEFSELFKVKADFDYEMPRDDEHEYQYALFIANRCRHEGLRHFDRPAVEKVVEFGARLAEHQDRLSTRFGEIANLLREASYWAGTNGRKVVAAADVQFALNERIYRANRIEEKLQEDVTEGQLLLSISGVAVGQVNGLSVVDMGDYAFGRPGRITARTYMGESGVVNIEREVDLAGPIHNKGLLTLVGYLGGQYAQANPLSISASLTFEQNYSGIEGDSASAAELYALLSSLGNVPLRQGIAVTGSVNQQGEVQPVGGVTEKIEGFFRVCRAAGLTGDQGVLIPAANVCHLMLEEEVVEAISQGQFHVWAIRHVDEGLELLTGMAAGEQEEDGSYPAGTVHQVVQSRLRKLARELKAFGSDED